MFAFYQSVEGEGRLVAVTVLLALLLWETIHPFFGFFRRHAGTRLRHAARNFILGILNAAMVSTLFVGAWLWAAETAGAYRFGLLYWLDAPPALHALGSVLLFDCWTYWWHRANHEIGFLWRFHTVHHTDNAMDVTTANRFHLGEIFLSSLLRIPLILLFGAKLWHLALYEALMFPVVQFHHANIGLSPSLDRLLRLVLVTPAMHKVHHSRWRTETDSNYTSFLSIWDRIFRTFRLRRNPHEIEFGLDGYDTRDRQSLPGLLKTPLKK